MLLELKKFQDTCKKILSAVDNEITSIVTETLEIVTKNNELCLNVTNSEYYVSIKQHIDSSEELRAVVDAKLFLNLISKFTTEQVELKISNGALVVKGNGQYKLPMVFDVEDLVELPKIEILNQTTSFNISSDILLSILNYNSREIKKDVGKPVQKMYYVDEKGCITFTEGACVNSFVLQQPIQLLLTNKVVKLFKLFDGGDVKFTLGFDEISSNYVVQKVRFENDNIAITSILPNDTSLLNSVPVSALRNWANKPYLFQAEINKDELLQALNRLLLVINSSKAFSDYGTITFKSNQMIIDFSGNGSEVIKYANTLGDIEESIEIQFTLLKSVIESCDDEYVTINFGGDIQTIVISRGNVKNVVPLKRA